MISGKRDSSLKLYGAKAPQVKAKAKRPRSSVASGGSTTAGRELFNSTAPIKFFTKLDDSANLRDSLQGAMALPVPGKKNFLAASMRLNSSQIREPRGEYSSGPQLNATLSSTSKKQRIRQKIMNSSYICGSLGAGSVTSETTKQRRRKSLVDAEKPSIKAQKQNSLRNSLSSL